MFWQSHWPRKDREQVCHKEGVQFFTWSPSDQCFHRQKEIQCKQFHEDVKVLKNSEHF